MIGLTILGVIGVGVFVWLVLWPLINPKKPDDKG
jgi:hypothetical protein